MVFSILLLLVIGFLAYRAAPREKKEHAHVHGAGQIGLAAALALFGVDYFTSFYYATGEMMSALHPYGLQNYGYIAVAVIAIANAVFGALYMYSLGIFNEGGGSYTASMRYLWPTLSLIVAVVLIQDYVFTIVVSSLSGVDQLLSILKAYSIDWVWHFLIGAALVAVTYYLTIRGRGESSRVVFMLLGVFLLLSVVMTIGLIMAHTNGVPAVVTTDAPKAASLGDAAYHMLTASMKGMVALSGLEAMSNGIQFVINEDSDLVKWGKKHLPKLHKIWGFYSGKSGIGRAVQTSFLFYGGLTTLILTTFAIRFNVFDGTLGRTLVGNLAFIGFGQLPGGDILYWAYQLLAVALLAAASMTAFQDLQATAWRDVAIGEIPEIVVYRNQAGTFTRSVTAGFVASLVIMFLVRGQTTLAVPFYGVGVFMPIMVMGLAVRQHVLKNFTGRKRFWGVLGSTLAAVLAAVVFVGQIVGKWEEGGWVVLISFSVLAIAAHALLLSPIGYRQPKQIYRIVRDKARVQGAMASIVEWQSLRMQEYRYNLRNRLLVGVSHFFELFGVRRPIRYEPVPAHAGGYDDVVHSDHPDAPSLLTQYLDNGAEPEPHLGGQPNETAAPDSQPGSRS
jgi:amino acid transporter